MPRYIDTDYRSTSSGNFMQRYAKAHEDKQASEALNSEQDFQAGYRAGSLRLGVASKNLNLKFAGLDRYLEAKNDGLSVIWRREGDQIIRLDNDTSWIDELLQIEGNN